MIIEIKSAFVDEIKGVIKSSATDETAFRKYVHTAIKEKVFRDKHPNLTRPKIIINPNPNSNISRRDVFLLGIIVSASIIVAMVVSAIITSAG